MNKTIKAFIDTVNAGESQLLMQSLGKGRAPVREGLSLGSLELNNALSGSPLIGFAFGRIVEVSGDEGSGKTTLALHTMREAQRRGLICAYLDVEHALDPEYAARIGVDVENMGFSQPDWGEQAITIARRSVLAGARLIVVDSVAALTPKAELEGETGDAFMGKHPKLMGQAMRQLVGITAKAHAVILFINQTRQKIGVFFGDPTTTTGGKALKFFASYRLMCSTPRKGASQEKVADETIETGIDMNVVVKKNKLYPPFRKATVHIEYGRGFDLYSDAATFMVKRVGDGKNVTIGKKSYSKNKLIAALHTDVEVGKQMNQMLKDYQS